MLKRRVLKLAVTAVTVLSTVGVTALAATAASASPARPAQRQALTTSRGTASPDVITDSEMASVANGLWVETTGHSNPVIMSQTKASILSQIDCKDVVFPNGETHPVCLLENESGLCLDQSSVYNYVTAESCESGDSQEWWWAKSTGVPDDFWIINEFWSSTSNYEYMTESDLDPGSLVQVAGPGYGTRAEWVYG